MAGGASPAVPLFGKTLILCVADTSGGADSQEPAYTSQQNPLLMLSHPYCCHTVNSVGLFCPVLTNFWQQEPNSRP